MKAFFGTDAKCAAQRAQGERMVADAEAKIATLQHTLDARPVRNLDEAMYDLTHRHGG